MRATPRARVEAWEARLGAHDKLRVGVVWSGNPAHGNDRNRSMRFATLCRILDCDARFISLQKDPRPEDVTSLRERSDIVDLTAHLTDFVETLDQLGLDIDSQFVALLKKELRINKVAEDVLLMGCKFGVNVADITTRTGRTLLQLSCHLFARFFQFKFKFRIDPLPMKTGLFGEKSPAAASVISPAVREVLPE